MNAARARAQVAAEEARFRLVPLREEPEFAAWDAGTQQNLTAAALWNVVDQLLRQVVPAPVLTPQQTREISLLNTNIIGALAGTAADLVKNEVGFVNKYRKLRARWGVTDTPAGMNKKEQRIQEM